MADAVRLYGFSRRPPNVEHGMQRECEQGGGRDRDEKLVAIFHEFPRVSIPRLRP